jgi:hypothetical protein
MPITEAFQDRVDGAPRVLEHLAAGQERAKDVHKHHLPRIVAEVLVIKRHDDFGLVGFKAPLHQGSKGPVSRALDTVGNVERGEPHVGIFPERTGIEEAAGLKEVEPMLVACRPQVLPIKVMRPFCIGLTCRCVVAMIGQKGDEIARSAGAYSAAAELQCGARPIGVALCQQRQIEEPFAGIIDDSEFQGCNTAANPAEQETERAGRNETDVDLDFADVSGAGRPVGGGSRHVLDISLIGKARQPLRLAAGEPGCN